MEFDYYTARKIRVTMSIEKEIEFYEGLIGLDKIVAESYVGYLRTRLGQDKKPNGPQVYYDGRGVRREVEALDMETYGRVVDEMVYQKDWKSLKEIHRIFKIDEYVNGLEYPDEISQKTIEKNRAKIKDAIITGLRSKKFVKGKAEIDYDKDAMKIVDISSVCFSNSKGIYRVKWS
jgi:hypothetical protein